MMAQKLVSRILQRPSLFENISKHGSSIAGNLKQKLVHGKAEYRCKRIYQGKVKAVIFDWAGTVVDSGVLAPLRTFVELFEREGVQITEEEARGPMGAHKRVHIQKILENDSVLDRWKKHHGGHPKDEDIDRMYRQFSPTILSCIDQYSDVITGVAQTVSKLQSQGLKIGSTTGYPLQVLEVILKSAGRHGYLPDASIAADQVPMARPCPYMVWACAMKMGVHPVQALVKVDDTVDGIGEGLSAGCWTIAVAKTSNYVGMTESQLAEAESKGLLQKKLDRAYEILVNSGAHYVIDTVNDIPDVIGDINKRLAAGESP